MKTWKSILLCCTFLLGLALATPTLHDVRLVGGAGVHEGTVQVLTDDGWRVLCDDSFDFAVADVVCRQLGYTGAARYMGNNVYGTPTLPWYDVVKCSGQESSLRECHQHSQGNEACVAKEVAGVVCRAGIWANCGVGQFQCGSYNLHTCIDRNQICDGIEHCFDKSDEDPRMCGDFGVVQVGSAMNNGSGVIGPLRIKHQGRWSTMCDDDFNQAEAQVVCRSLGYETAILYNEAFLGEGTGFVRNIVTSCTGKERWLSECPDINWDREITCTHKEDVGLLCSNKMDVRLVGGSGPHEGRLEVFLAGEWGTVCNRDFDHYDAKVVCRMLGFNGDANVIKDSSRFGVGGGPIWLDTLDCNGTESQLEACITPPFLLPKCGHDLDAAVSCSHTRKSTVDRDLAARLMPSSSVCGRTADTSAVFVTSLAKVVRGRPQKRLNFPWLAALYFKSGEKFTYKCGAAIISEWYLLSAAHCFRRHGFFNYVVKVGDFHIDKQDPGEQTFSIEKVRVSPTFDIPFKSNNDIIILKVAPVGGQGIRFGPLVQPVCLPPEDTDYISLKNCTVTGWGHTEPKASSSVKTELSNVPNVARLQIFQKEQCIGPNQRDAIAVRSNTVCAGDLLGGESICNGDSGSPMTCLGKDGRWHIHGIASTVVGCGLYGYPPLFAKVTKFLRWIQEELETL
ncbi:neurotrypsin-like [Oratosquilla oratoria]|uniref:neurotrypsin-like n=1 Tax=Oratosquilla oratoria TaxID=337810 RepID=UPI003F75C799